ncbi:MYG1 family protein [Pseudoalteromonas sp. MMG010]|uniref:MYG1 family protein n=1 Tax=Pseudoalteromonas sp. MMG010 TaxID=2822685 RepID=UPI001B3A1E15|nr:MYG1 family protein [Pseudoalteromonas sp. MMG010]MBQ4834540.1 MYG1 family protein [Pseudoalteromonas sp. MMG010]
MTELTVVTHSGNFHADDVFSIAVLKHALASFKLVRTRDKAKIESADIVIDVGGEYNPETGRFDHHQRGGAGARENGIPYSSFGLVWQHYGLALCNNEQAVADRVDAGLVSTIDAIDCGYGEGVATGISLSQTISMFNPTWEEPSEFDQCFDRAVDFAVTMLTRFIASARGSINAKDIVAKAIDNAPDPRLIELEQYTPWKKTVHQLSNEALYMLYPSQNGQWIIQTVPIEPGSFEDRQSLPASWAGLSDEEFQAHTGIADAVFCHNGLFIAGTRSRESTLKLAEMALNQ